MASYNYTVSTDFPNGEVAPDRLSKEIAASAIVTALNYIQVLGDTCEIVFKANISAGDETILDGLVAAHQGEPLPSTSQPVRLTFGDDDQNVPTTADGRLIELPNSCPLGTNLYVASFGDDPVAGRGNGHIFASESDGAGDTAIETGFNDLVYLLGGGGFFVNAAIGDWMSCGIKAPASVVTPNGTNTGNCNLLALGGGMHMILPAAGNGTHDIDLATAATPVPSYDDHDPRDTPDGLWDWDFPTEGRGTITPSATQTGKFNLFDFDILLTRHAKIAMLGDKQFEINRSVEPRSVLPHWKCHAVIHNVGHADLKVAWWMTMARVKTV